MPRFTGNFEMRGWALVNITDGKTIVSLGGSPPSPQLTPDELVNDVELGGPPAPHDVDGTVTSYREIVPGELVEAFCGYMSGTPNVYRWDGGAWRNEGLVGNA